jgi:hypothetical protein
MMLVLVTPRSEACIKKEDGQAKAPYGEPMGWVDMHRF